MSAQLNAPFKINGDLTAGEDLTIDCIFDGSIQLQGHHLTVTAKSQMQAAVSAETVTVHGQFEGQIQAETLHVTAGADVNATVITNKLMIQEGAQFSGAVNTERARAAAEVAKHRQASSVGSKQSAGASRQTAIGSRP
jgi:cytoskeletal protein CcmA (bactofilin family)